MTNSQIERRRAFTLIELLVVISIIALLLSILMPGLKRAKDLAKRTICATRLRQVGTAMVNYSLDYDDKLPDSLDQNGKPEFGHGYVVYREEIVDTSGKPKIGRASCRERV